MSLFMPPISPIKDKTTGRTLKSATMTPLRTVELGEVYKLITSNEKLAALTLEVRNASLQGDVETYRRLKQQTLPYVTPCGVFTRRRSDCLAESSGPENSPAVGTLGTQGSPGSSASHTRAREEDNIPDSAPRSPLPTFDQHIHWNASSAAELLPPNTTYCCWAPSPHWTPAWEKMSGVHTVGK